MLCEGHQRGLGARQPSRIGCSEARLNNPNEEYGCSRPYAALQIFEVRCFVLRRRAQRWAHLSLWRFLSSTRLHDLVSSARCYDTSDDLQASSDLGAHRLGLSYSKRPERLKGSAVVVSPSLGSALVEASDHGVPAAYSRPAGIRFTSQRPQQPLRLFQSSSGRRRPVLGRQFLRGSRLGRVPEQSVFARG